MAISKISGVSSISTNLNHRGHRQQKESPKRDTFQRSFRETMETVSNNTYSKSSADSFSSSTSSFMVYPTSYSLLGKVVTIKDNHTFKTGIIEGVDLNRIYINGKFYDRSIVKEFVPMAQYKAARSKIGSTYLGENLKGDRLFGQISDIVIYNKVVYCIVNNSLAILKA